MNKVNKVNKVKKQLNSSGADMYRQDLYISIVDRVEAEKSSLITNLKYLLVMYHDAGKLEEESDIFDQIELVKSMKRPCSFLNH